MASCQKRMDAILEKLASKRECSVDPFGVNHWGIWFCDEAVLPIAG